MSVRIGTIENLLSNFLNAKEYSKIVVITDKNTKKHCYPLIKKTLPKHLQITVEPGEENKNIETCLKIWDQMTQFELDRHALIINLGGGVLGDMGGFCAATYKRGIDFIQIPTTLLAQVDASVGGKLGIDFQGLKNHIGVFTQPQAVLIDDVFLKTLSIKELRSGFAEIIKHCLIRDKDQWNIIKKTDFEDMPFHDLIHHSVEIKKQIVAEDPTEKGIRKILNFGHTIGHAVETFYLEKDRLLHGEAIAVGMICEAYLAYTRKMILEDELYEIEEFVYSIFGTVKMDPNHFDAIALHTLQDKKNKGSQIRASIINGIGNCDYDVVISKQDIVKSLKYYCGIW